MLVDSLEYGALSILGYVLEYCADVVNFLPRSCKETMQSFRSEGNELLKGCTGPRFVTFAYLLSISNPCGLPEILDVPTLMVLQHVVSRVCDGCKYRGGPARAGYVLTPPCRLRQMGTEKQRATNIAKSLKKNIKS